MKDYHSTHMVPYEQPKGHGFDYLPVCPYLWGRLWDEMALAYVHSLRPSCIRVTTGEIKTDARIWRVTVVVDENDMIKHIMQEVEFGAPIPWRDRLRQQPA